MKVEIDLLHLRDVPEPSSEARIGLRRTTRVSLEVRARDPPPLVMFMWAWGFAWFTGTAAFIVIVIITVIVVTRRIRVPHLPLPTCAHERAACATIGGHGGSLAVGTAGR